MYYEFVVRFGGDCCYPKMVIRNILPLESWHNPEEHNRQFTYLYRTLISIYVSINIWKKYKCWETQYPLRPFFSTSIRHPHPRKLGSYKYFIRARGHIFEAFLCVKKTSNISWFIFLNFVFGKQRGRGCVCVVSTMNRENDDTCLDVVRHAHSYETRINFPPKSKHPYIHTHTYASKVTQAQHHWVSSVRRKSRYEKEEKPPGVYTRICIFG